MLASKVDTHCVTAPGVSEIILTGAGDSATELVMPMLAHLSYKAGSRWLSWIGDAPIAINTFDDYQFKKDNVRLIHSHNDAETLWMLWDALSNGTSAFVVAKFHAIKFVQKSEIEKLQQACYSGNSRALILKHH